jgi:uncharacterized membrane protein
MKDLTALAGDALRPDFSMGWNFLLALAPLLLAWVLSRRPGRPGVLWWLGLVLFVLFLPNAPYALTDLLHFVRKARQQPLLPEWALVVFTVPEYVLYVGACLLSYVLSLLLLGDYLRRQGKARWVRPLEALTHALCAAGVYLGRVVRLNSWDALADPEAVVGAASGAVGRGRPAAFILGTMLVLVAAYYPLKFVVEAVLARWRGASS